MNQDTYLSDRQLAERYAVLACADEILDHPTNLPKISRLYLCADIIVAWKAIKGVDDMPRRLREFQSEFTGFLEALTTLAGLHSKNINIDELHKNILDVEKAGR